MFVILSYDVGEKRVSKASRIVRKYLMPVQKSLYQGFLSEKQISRLENELARGIDPRDDSVVIYKMLSENDVMVDYVTAGDAVGEFVF